MSETNSKHTIADLDTKVGLAPRISEEEAGKAVSYTAGYQVGRSAHLARINAQRAQIVGRPADDAENRYCTILEAAAGIRGGQAPSR